MNLGIYIQNLNNKHEVEIANSIIGYSISEKLVNDVCLFYDNIAQINQAIPFSMFNSTDIWNFHGKLVVLSLDCARYVLNVVNNFDIYYLYGIENINILNLLDLLNKNVKVICPTKESKREYFRTTGTFPIGTSSKTKNITQFILGEK